MLIAADIILHDGEDGSILNVDVGGLLGENGFTLLEKGGLLCLIHSAHGLRVGLVIGSALEVYEVLAAFALEACQHESGLWHTILDDEDSYLETSASCAFAYGILKAVRMGCLPARFVQMGEKAVKGVMNQIAEDGTVGGVSYGTPVFNTIQEYKDIPICPMPYGQSMALMMLVEASK